MRVVFDLDGTLVDSTADLLAAINPVLHQYGLAESDRSENLRYAGHGIVAMFKNTIDARVSDWSVEKREGLATQMGALYSQNPVALTRPFDGVGELLDELSQDAIELCVISNKPSALSQLILGTLFPSIAFLKVFGPDSGYAPKPDPSSLASCRSGMGDGDLLIYVGDTEIDYQTASGTADRVYLASWGYRGRTALLAMGFDENIIVEKPMDLISIVRTKGEMV